MKYYLIAGEASGDLHGSLLIQALKKINPNAEFRAWGGDKMMAQGATIVKHIRELAFMGFAEVLSNLPIILKNFELAQKDIESFSPDALILIDYPGFNLRLAQKIKKTGIPILYYISPQIWAWKESRIHQIKRNVDLMMVILPFEEQFYAKHHMKVHFVGHPLLDEIIPSIEKIQRIPNRIALLPGSRKQEVKRMLIPMIQGAKKYNPHATLEVAMAPSLSLDFYHSVAKDFVEQVIWTAHDTYHVIQRAEKALVTSGTATLETALFKTPQVVGYRSNKWSYEIGKRLVKIPYISLVNLILNRPLVKELIQQKFNSSEIAQALLKLDDQDIEIQSGYHDLSEMLGGGGASHRAAILVQEYLAAHGKK